MSIEFKTLFYQLLNLKYVSWTCKYFNVNFLEKTINIYNSDAVYIDYKYRHTHTHKIRLRYV